MNHNNNEESIQFHVIQFLNAWKDCAGLPNLPTTIFPGAGELTKIIKELPDSVKIQIYSSLQGIIDQKK